MDGKRFLTTVVAGYEVGCRVAMTGGASQLRRGFHPSATSGTFAAGAAAAKMLRLNPLKTLHALEDTLLNLEKLPDARKIAKLLTP